MIPDPATIARRRHTVTIIVRFLIAAYGAWVLYRIAVQSIAPALSMLFSSLENIALALTNMLGGLIYSVPEIALLAGFVFFEQKLVRWIVPAGDPGHLCPKCGYSLKDLKSPICPECGTNLRV